MAAVILEIPARRTGTGTGIDDSGRAAVSRCPAPRRGRTLRWVVSDSESAATRNNIVAHMLPLLTKQAASAVLLTLTVWADRSELSACVPPRAIRLGITMMMSHI